MSFREFNQQSGGIKSNLKLANFQINSLLTIILNSFPFLLPHNMELHCPYTLWLDFP